MELKLAKQFLYGKYLTVAAIYGQEWGIINNGGRLNIFNGNELPGWDVNERQELLADTPTPKNDYAALFAPMRQRGWTTTPR